MKEAQRILFSESKVVFVPLLPHSAINQLIVKIMRVVKNEWLSRAIEL